MRYISRLLLLAALVLSPSCSGGIDARVSTDNAVGQYTAVVSNGTEDSHTVVCTVTASTGDTDRFTLTLHPGERVKHKGKVSLRDFTNDLDIVCTGATL